MYKGITEELEVMVETDLRILKNIGLINCTPF